MDTPRQFPTFASYEAEQGPDTAPVIFAEGVTAVGILSGNLHMRLEVLIHEQIPGTRQVESKRRAVVHLHMTMPCAQDVKVAIGELQQLSKTTPGTA